MYNKLKISLNTVISFVLIVIIIYSMSLMYPNYKDVVRKLDSSYQVYRILFTLLTFCIGLIIEFDKIKRALKKGIRINPLGILISIIILIFLFLPIPIVMTITGFGPLAIIMQEGFFRSILGLISGFVFSRSIS